MKTTTQISSINFHKGSKSHAHTRTRLHKSLHAITFTTTALLILNPVVYAQTTHSPTQDSAHSFSYAMHTCTDHEKWTTQAPQKWGSIDDERIVEFSNYLKGKSTSIVSFSQALSLRRLAAHAHDRIFSEYWISRSLLGAGMVHLAESGFQAILSQPTTDSALYFQLAAVECLNQIRTQHGVFSIDSQTAAQKHSAKLLKLINELPESGNFVRSSLWESALNLLNQELSPGVLAQTGNNHSHAKTQSAQTTQNLLKVLKGSGPYQTLAKGILASRSYADGINHTSKKRSTQVQAHAQAVLDQKNVVKYLKKFLQTQSKSTYLRTYNNYAHLLLGRALYSLGEYNQAVQAYRKIGVRSNEWVHALSELSWSYLMDEKYRESIGVGVGVQTGALRHTFCPESIMVTAMALNEMCYFPESLKMVNKFKKDYVSSFDWLKKWAGQSRQKTTPKISKGSSQDLDKSLNLDPRAQNYRLAIAYAKNSPDLNIPTAVASEWVRSPVFLTNQEKINLLLNEQRTSESLSQKGAKTQRDLASKLIVDINTLKEQYAKAKINLKNGQQLPVGIQTQVSKLRDQIQLHHQVRHAAPYWRKMLGHFQVASKVESKKSVHEISAYIDLLNQRMLTQLEEIAANHDLLEVEILNGASEDIVWQNAHPDFNKTIQKMKRSKTEHPSASVWNWGNSLGGLDGRGEIWEDEVGSLTANLRNNCENKTRYLAVKHQMQAEM